MNDIMKEKFQEFYHKNEMIWDLLVRLKWYSNNLKVKIMDDETFNKKLYYKMFKKKLNLEDPVTLDEKQIYLKLHNRDSLLTMCSDKVKVREYIKQCGLQEILIPQIGVYDNAEEIPFDSFDEPVFIKCNHGSGGNRIYDPQNPFNVKRFKKRCNFLLKQNQYNATREWNYKNIEPKIECEKVLRSKNGNLPIDYKFYCFGGKPIFLGFSVGTCDEKGEHALDSQRFFNTYDMEWNLIDVDQGYPIMKEKNIEKPNTFEEMKKICEILATPFPFVRVDLYDIDGKVYFGELTFYDNGGFANIQPEDWNIEMAKKIDLGNIKKD